MYYFVKYIEIAQVTCLTFAVTCLTATFPFVAQ